MLHVKILRVGWKKSKVIQGEFCLLTVQVRNTSSDKTAFFSHPDLMIIKVRDEAGRIVPEAAKINYMLYSVRDLVTVPARHTSTFLLHSPPLLKPSKGRYRVSLYFGSPYDYDISAEIKSELRYSKAILMENRTETATASFIVS